MNKFGILKRRDVGALYIRERGIRRVAMFARVAAAGAGGKERAEAFEVALVGDDRRGTGVARAKVVGKRRNERVVRAKGFGGIDARTARHA